MERKTTDAKAFRKEITPDLDKKAKDFASADFWHYTSLENGERILIGNTPGFVVSSFSTMNDLDEKDLHRLESDKIFSLCFCNTDKEKIPMWYMYSDFEGKGVSLGFTPARMKKLINSIEEVYPFVNGNVIFEKPLKKNIDFDIQAGWVVYRNPSEKYNFHFKSKWYDNVTPLKEFEKDNYFIKLYPWYYEDEFRIVFKFKECNFDKIYIKMPDVKVKLLIGPGFYNEEMEKFELPEKLIASQNVLKYSTSKLKINMNLAQRHMRAFLRYIEKNCK